MYLGLDLSLTQTGWAVVDKKGTKIASGIFPYKISEVTLRKKVERLINIETDVFALFEKYKIKAVGVEGYAFATRNTNNLVNLGELGGVIRRGLFLVGHDPLEVPPTKVKLFGTGKGNCNKDLILLQVFKKYGEEFATSDEADAFIISQIVRLVDEYASAGKIAETLTEYQKRALKEF